MANRDPFFKTKINRFKGVSGTGDMLGEMIDRYQLPATYLEPGDYALDGSFDLAKTEIVKQVFAPISYDLWYFKHAVNILSRTTDGFDYIPEMDTQKNNMQDSNIDVQFDFLNTKLLGIAPMMFIRDLKQLVRPNPYYQSWTPPDLAWIAYNEYFIHLIAYEMWHPQMAAQCDSSGPGNSHGFIRNDAVGYLAFPVGQLGVMEVVSILKQSELEVSNFNLPVEQQPITTTTSDFFFTPADQYTGHNQCFGEHIIESGYVIPEDNGSQGQPNKKANLEYLEVTPIPTNLYADVKPQYWMRYWIHKNEQFPVPGEFVGILVKPLALPPHAWWFQKTSPFVYAGNWVETNNLTSGVVTEKITEANRTDGGIGTEYKVKVHGWEIYVYASDYMNYNIGDRVALLKTPSVKDTASTTSFMWTDMYMMEEMDKERKTYDYIILPISFYK